MLANLLVNAKARVSKLAPVDPLDYLSSSHHSILLIVGKGKHNLKEFENSLRANNRINLVIHSLLLIKYRLLLVLESKMILHYAKDTMHLHKNALKVFSST